MSGSTSFSKKGGAAIDPAAVADLSPVSESDDIFVPIKPSKPEGQHKKLKKVKKAKKSTEATAQGKADGKTNAETDAAGSQTKATSSS